MQRKKLSIKTYCNPHFQDNLHTSTHQIKSSRNSCNRYLLSHLKSGLITLRNVQFNLLLQLFVHFAQLTHVGRRARAFEDCWIVGEHAIILCVEISRLSTTLAVTHHVQSLCTITARISRRCRCVFLHFSFLVAVLKLVEHILRSLHLRSVALI